MVIEIWTLIDRAGPLQISYWHSIGGFISALCSFPLLRHFEIAVKHSNRDLDPHRSGLRLYTSVPGFRSVGTVLVASSLPPPTLPLLGDLQFVVERLWMV